MARSLTINNLSTTLISKRMGVRDLPGYEKDSSQYNCIDWVGIKAS